MLLSVLAEAFVAVLPFALGARAAPTVTRRSAAATKITSTTVAAYRPYTYYAAAAYCGVKTTLAWDCGGNCNLSPNFTPTAAGGDGSGVQWWFTGYDSDLKSVIVSHQGTDPSKLLSVLTDLAVLQTKLNTSTFPGIGSNLWVHSGFLNAHRDTISLIKTAVMNATARFNTTKVTFVGHSLGAAIALIDAAYFRTNLPTYTIAVRTYGLPRVGNADWANWVDTQLPDQVRITNNEDPIPIVPGRFLGYNHPSGEVHAVTPLIGTQSWYSCPGQDNTSPHCSIGDTPNIFGSNILDHLGPYDGILMGLCWLNGKK
ncbi:lipase [Auriculariales sp. MPI-PUGE-AT-0066]|nr:lipase [Auriculariales sp. MPI-PUGE-AT-0066]